MKESEEQNPNTFSLCFKKNKPRKKNPETYTLKTIDDIFQLINPKNFNRFFKEFKMGMESSMLMREAIIAIEKEKGNEVVEPLMNMPQFKWIDD